MLPRSDLVEYRVGNGADQVGRDADLIQLLEVPLDLTHAHPARVERDHLGVEPWEPPGVLRHQLGLKGACAIARHLQSQGVVVREHGLRGRPIPMIRLARRFDAPVLVPEVMRQFRVQHPLDDHLLHRPEQSFQLLRRLRVSNNRVNGRRIKRRPRVGRRSLRAFRHTPSSG